MVTTLGPRPDVRVGAHWNVDQRTRGFCIRCGMERQMRPGRSRLCRDCQQTDPHFDD